MGGTLRLLRRWNIIVSTVMPDAAISSGSIRISVVIPVYNEGAALTQLVPEITHQLNLFAPSDWEILVVDDGSTDEISAVSQMPGVKLLRHTQRTGSGAARKTGSRAAAGQIIAWIDGDGTYSAVSLTAALTLLNGGDQVIGARSTDYGYLRLLRLAAKNGTARITGFLWTTSIPDLNSGLRVFRRESLLAWIDELPDGFSCTTTATLAALNHRQRVLFLPISYRPRHAESSSKFHPLIDTLRLWRAVWRCWCRR